MMFLKWGQSDQSVPIGLNYFFLQGVFLSSSRKLIATMTQLSEKFYIYTLINPFQRLSSTQEINKIIGFPFLVILQETTHFC